MILSQNNPGLRLDNVSDTNLGSVQTVLTQADDHILSHIDSHSLSNTQTSVDATDSHSPATIDTTVTEQTATFKYLDVKNLTDREKEALMGRLTLEYRGIIDQYSKLNQHVIQSLKGRRIESKELSGVLMYLQVFCVQKPTVKSLLSEHIDEIEAKDIDGAFRILRSYGSFFDIFILKHIVESHLCTNDKRKKLKEYEEMLENYCRRSIFECPPDIVSI